MLNMVLNRRIGHGDIAFIGQDDSSSNIGIEESKSRFQVHNVCTISADILNLDVKSKGIVRDSIS